MLLQPGGPPKAFGPGPAVRRPKNRAPGAGVMESGRAGRLGGTEAAPPPFAHVAPSLFLGNARAAAAPELLARARVTLCVNVSRQQPGPRAPGVAELRVPVFDDPAEDLLAHLEPTCAAMEAAVRAGGACLVYCKNGRSRSAAVCTAYLMRHRGLTLAQAFQTVKSARPVAEPNPGFWSQLQKYEEALQSRSGLPRDPSGQ
ncbi:dual specificity phosphatase 28 isoform X3 [Saccopteryx bilineata]|uniref:dual specificity phosphatase 28 isoform X3 n=2 Tax=Saccopteryx TaxID=59481 RepID=UPI00339073EC